MQALVLATISFALSFAAWGLVGGLATVFTGLYHLTASQTALLVAVPVLLGSLARLPMGMLTDCFGGRLCSRRSSPSLARRLRRAADRQLRLAPVAAFLVGMAGSSFAVGAAFVSRWTPAPAGHRPRRLRPRDDGSVAGGLCRTGRRGPLWLGSGLSRHERAAPGLGGGVLPVRAESPAALAVPLPSPR